jgi:hypothetical protein
MKKKVIYLLIAVLILFGLFFLLLKGKGEEKYFLPVELSNNNTITNNVLPKYLDTILSVGLDQLGLVGVNLVVNDMSESAQSLVPNYELKAHIREWNGTFYLFVGDFDKENAITILSHELIHIHQYYSEELKYSEGFVYWKGDEFDLNGTEYDKRPWEEDAFDREKPLSNAISNVLFD